MDYRILLKEENEAVKERFEAGGRAYPRDCFRQK